MDYFLEAFHGMDRLGPGSVETTVRASNCIQNKQNIKKIVDIGCGTGSQTITLSKIFTNASLCGIDVDEFQIDIFKKKMIEHNLTSRISILNCSMTNLPFNKHSLDLIWAEGSIYIIGFRNGLRLWKKYLNNCGIIACSEVSWLCEPSKENYDYWKQNYSQIDYIENKFNTIKDCGYKLLDYYVLPRTDWKDNFYDPLEKNLEKMEEKYGGIKEARIIIDRLRYEIYLFSKYGNQYSYVFYIMKKEE